MDPLDELRCRILDVRRSARNGHDHHTWAEVYRAIVPAEHRDQVSRTLIWRIGTDPDYEPKDGGIRLALGLPEAATVTYVDGRPRPRAQALDVLECGCGRWFVSNHPRRKRCFVCSPYRGGRR